MTSTDAMDTEEGDAITKMILDKTKGKAERRQRRIISMGWDLDINDIPRPSSIPLPKSREKGNVQADQPVTAMSSLVLPEYEELDDWHTKRWENTNS